MYYGCYWCRVGIVADRIISAIAAGCSRTTGATDDPPPVISEFKVPDSSSASAYSRLTTSKIFSGCTMTSSTSIIFQKGKFSV